MEQERGAFKVNVVCFRQTRQMVSQMVRHRFGRPGAGNLINGFMVVIY
jgi:hypothetical protein